MHFEQGKLSVKNFELCAKLCACRNKSSHFLFILCTFRPLFSLKRLSVKKSLHLFHFLTNFSLHNTHIETLKLKTLKQIITNLIMISTHYAPKLCAKNTNYAPKLYVVHQKPNYALKCYLRVFLRIRVIA